MRQKNGPSKLTNEAMVKDIRRRPRKHHSSEKKDRIALEGLSGEDSLTKPCRRDGIEKCLHCAWSKELLEAGKKRLAGDTFRLATGPEVKGLRHEATALKEAVADLTLEKRLLKKSMLGDGGDEECGIRRQKSSSSPGR
ncbi:transposase [Pseudoponticoccus marisrubri]|uniref:Transposase n=1 Tax=Pseudoponticoccus marisrubri TaxID=1685382 RepID=A0A0W7WM98_9RHOB|nr:transposase [Pseudoponticoccus marisrubri]